MTRLLALVALLFLAACSTVGEPLGEKRIALTFDDIPRDRGAWLDDEERTRRLIAGLREAGVEQAAFFLNPGRIAEKPGSEARIAAYAAAGHVLANHAASHPRLSTTDAAAYLADIDAAEAWLKGRPGYRPWFRFPYLDEGKADLAKRDAIRAGLAARGLMNGYVTVDASDWFYEQESIAAVRAGKTVDRAALRDLYIESHVEAAEFTDALARRTLGRSPAHVLLLHETDLAAFWIADLVRALEAKGWTIVSADEAFADPISKIVPDVPMAQGTLIEAIAWQRGVPEPRWYPRNNTEVAGKLFQERVIKAAPAPTPVERHGQLRVEGGQLVDRHGRRVALRGMSLFWSQWKPQFYDSGVVRSLRDDWSVDVVRAAIAVEQGGYLSDRKAAMRHARTVIDAAIRDGIYVIVDWHAHNPHPAAAAEFFEEIARLYGDKPNLIYELWNEPYPRFEWARDIKPYHETLGARIRAIDPDAVLALGTPTWSSRPDIAAADPVSLGNVAYVMHFYATSHGEEMMDHVRRAVTARAAVMATEWGTCEYTGDGRVDPEATARWMRLLDEYAISAANWSINDKAESCAALTPGTRPSQVGDSARRTASGRLVHGYLQAGGED